MIMHWIGHQLFNGPKIIKENGTKIGWTSNCYIVHDRCLFCANVVITDGVIVLSRSITDRRTGRHFLYWQQYHTDLYGRVRKSFNNLLKHTIIWQTSNGVVSQPMPDQVSLMYQHKRGIYTSTRRSHTTSHRYPSGAYVVGWISVRPSCTRVNAP